MALEEWKLKKETGELDKELEEEERVEREEEEKRRKELEVRWGAGRERRKETERVGGKMGSG